MEPNNPDRPRRSLLHVMKLVVFCAVALACVTPMLHLWRAGFVLGGGPQGLIVVALFEAVVVPLVWVGLSFALISRGVWRDGLITAFLLCSVSVALGMACWRLIAYTVPAYGNPYDPSETRVGVSFLTLHIMAILALAAASLFLMAQLRRGSHRGSQRSKELGK